MPDKTISEENPAGRLQNDDAFRIARAGENFRGDVEGVAEFTEEWMLRRLSFNCSPDQTTALTAGTGKFTFHWPFTGEVAALWVGLATPQSSGSIFTVDVNDGGASMLSTKITVENGEETSLTAAAQPVLSDALVTRGGKATVDIDQVGDGTATGLNLYIEYRVYNGGSP